MPQAETGIDGSRFGYIPNPSKPNKYPPLNTHRYLVHASWIGGSLRGRPKPQISVPTSHHRTPIYQVPWVPATPTGRPRPPHRPSDRKWVKRRTWREQRKRNRWLRRPADPAPLGMDLSPADSGARPPLQRGWARGRRFTQDLGRGTGLEVE